MSLFYACIVHSNRDFGGISKGLVVPTSQAQVHVHARSVYRLFSNIFSDLTAQHLHM